MNKSQKIQSYALALFQLAQEQGIVDRLLKEFELLLALEQADATLKTFLELPVASEEEKIRVVHSALGSQISQILLQLMEMLIRKNQFYYLAPIAAAYQTLADEQANRVRAKALTVLPLAPEYYAPIQEILGQALKKTVVLNNILAPDIIGGIILQVSGLHIDCSLRYKLSRLRRQLQTASEQRQKKVLSS